MGVTAVRKTHIQTNRNTHSFYIFISRTLGAAFSSESALIHSCVQLSSRIKRVWSQWIVSCSRMIQLDTGFRGVATLINQVC